MLKAALIMTVAYVAAVTVGGIRVYAQTADVSDVVDSKALADGASVMKLNVNVDSFLLWPSRKGDARRS
jgi:hypothetical protein